MTERSKNMATVSNMATIRDRTLSLFIIIKQSSKKPSVANLNYTEGKKKDEAILSEYI